MFKKRNYNLSLGVNVKQFVVAAVTLILVLALPFIYTYVKDPNKKSIRHLISSTIEGSGAYSEGEESFVVNIPVVNYQVDLSVVERNPQLLIYVGVVFLVIAFLIIISLVRNYLGNRN